MQPIYLGWAAGGLLVGLIGGLYAGNSATGGQQMSWSNPTTSS